MTAEFWLFGTADTTNACLLSIGLHEQYHEFYQPLYAKLGYGPSEGIDIKEKLLDLVAAGGVDADSKGRFQRYMVGRRVGAV